ncbi:MAG: hypothetical protein FJY77_01700 [Candidatus Altiarchaeales archaeon]|nr:hypothetical protein [Candidatus Altiarchaeales archaeon]
MTVAHTETEMNETTGIMPGRVSVRNTWALLRKEDKLTALFWYDQMKLRFQYAIRREYLPTPSWWKKKKIKRDIERLFEDVDEEIYFEEKLVKEVKGHETQRKKIAARVQKEKEDLEEVLTGYDKFTTEEEKKIAEMTKKAIAAMERKEKEAGQI